MHSTGLATGGRQLGNSLERSAAAVYGYSGDLNMCVNVLLIGMMASEQ